MFKVNWTVALNNTGAFQISDLTMAGEPMGPGFQQGQGKPLALRPEWRPAKKLLTACNPLCRRHKQQALVTGRKAARVLWFDTDLFLW